MIIVKLLIFWLIMLGFSYLIGDFDSFIDRGEKDDK